MMMIINIIIIIMLLLLLLLLLVVVVFLSLFRAVKFCESLSMLTNPYVRTVIFIVI